MVLYSKNNVFFLPQLVKLVQLKVSDPGSETYNFTISSWIA